MSENTMEKTDASQVQALRQLTSAGMMDCKRALVEAKGDVEKAKELLRQRGLAIAQKKTGRSVSEGQIFSYLHFGGRIGVLVEINCETDFAARNDEFQRFGRDIAMQIAAAGPQFVSCEEAGSQWLEAEKNIFRAQIQDKPANAQERIIEGKLQKRYEEICLLNQKFIKDDTKTIQDLLTELIAKLGERVVIKRFRRFEVGSE